ncbi:uncharacterized protein K452DRAFT_261128 [Aplosporella prunicola CBS 121167]|uniref:Uncharacterized protein n=1 Tax=Aplosporella prunicola CBS 121167 TaxID=1176127 RepID=A0A6A6BT79_9PEZI|nr:uncharacterized protein K452DRAFT_261128 [Aplosporella prunicola CBS 121167]KAF2146998.1 hypothetical protein K452DRAFT_261128 [Aplosporella prunicola CBS 121167]
MGTRHLILVYYKGEYHIAQCGQWDGYPEGQGLVVLNFIRNPVNLAKLQAAIDNKRLYKPTEEQVEEIRRKNNELEYEMHEREYKRKQRQLETRYSAPTIICPTLSRDTGASILQIVADATEPVPIQLEVEFIADQLYCEWAYLIDLDARVLEVYSGNFSGFDQPQVQKSTHGRFPDWNVPDLVAKFTFDKMPEPHDKPVTEPVSVDA